MTLVQALQFAFQSAGLGPSSQFGGDVAPKAAPLEPDNLIGGSSRNALRSRTVLLEEPVGLTRHQDVMSLAAPPSPCKPPQLRIFGDFGLIGHCIPSMSIHRTRFETEFERSGVANASRPGTLCTEQGPC
jgi:hypothetical protein